MSEMPEAKSLLALMVLIEARPAARIGGGAMVLLANQDGALWG